MHLKTKPGNKQTNKQTHRDGQAHACPHAYLHKRNVTSTDVPISHLTHIRSCTGVCDSCSRQHYSTGDMLAWSMRSNASVGQDTYARLYCTYSWKRLVCMSGAWMMLKYWRERKERWNMLLERSERGLREALEFWFRICWKEGLGQTFIVCILHASIRTQAHTKSACTGTFHKCDISLHTHTHTHTHV